MIKFNVKDTIYNDPFTVYICSVSEINNVFKKRYNIDNHTQEGFDGTYSITKHTKTGKTESIVWVESFDYSPESFNTLSHELLHHLVSVMLSSGLKLSYDSEEAFTYYYGYIFEQVMRNINKSIPYKKTNKKKSINKK